MITVDCGITAVEQVKLASELGMDVIVTDHHQPDAVLPEAEAIVHPLTGRKLPQSDVGRGDGGV